MPDMWMRIPFIAMSNAELANYYDLTEGACAYIEVFDSNGNYKLQEKLEEAYNKMPASRTRFDKDLMKLDEQLNIFNQLIHYQRLNLFPKEDDPNQKWYAPGDDLSGFTGKDSMFVSRIMGWYLSEVQEGLKSGDWTKADEIVGMIHTYQQAKNKNLDISPERIQVELKYNKMEVFRYCKIGYLILGGLLLLFSFIMLFRQSRWMKAVVWILGIGVLIVFHYHMSGMGMRWYIGGYAPWSNSYETMVYVAWATVCGGLLFVRRSTITFALATLFGGIILFVSGLNWMDPEINPLVPVLKSPWLMFHVAVIVAAYGFFGISCLIGLTNMVMMSVSGRKNREILNARITELSIVNEMSLWVGLALMTIGTFLGAIWANESWGRYWGWDPKETWALITVVIYAVVTHLHLVKRWNNLWLFNLSSVIAFASVLMTFFGVNYFLSGMHSYGQNDNIQGIFMYLYGSLAIVVVLAVLSRMKWKSVLKEIIK
jgi:cytochrome c-type biogenesis protein CcsB